jgi:hypothetical protein
LGWAAGVPVGLVAEQDAAEGVAGEWVERLEELAEVRELIAHECVKPFS